MEEINCRYIVDALPYPVVFVDAENIIRFMNKAARFHYHEAGTRN